MNASDTVRFRPQRIPSQILATIFFLFLGVVITAFAESQTITEDGISVTYDTSAFSKVEVYEVKTKPAPDNPSWEVAPARLNFCFNCGPARKLSTNRGSLSIIPLQDRTLKDLEKSYPDLPRSVSKLKQLLRDRPKFARLQATEPAEVPTILNEDAGQIFLSKVRYLDFSWGAGIGFLVQYSQDFSPYAVGARLDYQIEALNNEGTVGVSASFRVAHPDLPKTEENEVMGNDRGHPTRQEYEEYVRRMERFLDGKVDSSFVPSLTTIQQIAASLRGNAQADPAGWNSFFRGKKIDIERTRHSVRAFPDVKTIELSELVGIAERAEIIPRCGNDRQYQVVMECGHEKGGRVKSPRCFEHRIPGTSRVCTCALVALPPLTATDRTAALPSRRVTTHVAKRSFDDKNGAPF